MRILLDECAPARLRLVIQGHEVRTVRQMQWASYPDGELLRRAGREFDVFLTVDKSIEFQQVLPPGLALITLVSRSIRFEALRALIPETLEALESIQAGDKIRIQR